MKSLCGSNVFQYFLRSRWSNKKKSSRHFVILLEAVRFSWRHSSNARNKLTVYILVLRVNRVLYLMTGIPISGLISIMYHYLKPTLGLFLGFCAVSTSMKAIFCVHLYYRIGNVSTEFLEQYGSYLWDDALFKTNEDRWLHSLCKLYMKSLVADFP